MSKKKLCLKDTLALQAKLDEVQKSARVRLLSAEEVQNKVNNWMSFSGANCVGVKNLRDVTLHIQASGEKFAKAYRGKPVETCVDLYHNGREWVVTDVYRNSVKSHNWTVSATLTTLAEHALIKVILTV